MAEMLHFCVTTPLSVSKTTSTSERVESAGKSLRSVGAGSDAATYYLVCVVTFKHLVAFKTGCFIEIVSDPQDYVKGADSEL
jgi:hypothetical protein